MGQSIDKQDKKLSEREIEVLHWICLGKTNWEIGMILGISIHTVKNHVKNILAKLNVYNRTQAVQQALSEGVVDLAA